MSFTSSRKVSVMTKVHPMIPKNKQCENPDCGIIFLMKRSDQKYCSSRCRLAVNNDRHKSSMFPYHDIIMASKKQDINIARFMEDKDEKYIDPDVLEQYHVKLEDGLRVNYDCHGEIMESIFGMFRIKRVHRRYVVYRLIHLQIKKLKGFVNRWGPNYSH